jgi:hypothetical protein
MPRLLLPLEFLINWKFPRDLSFPLYGVVRQEMPGHARQSASRAVPIISHDDSRRQPVAPPSASPAPAAYTTAREEFARGELGPSIGMHQRSGGLIPLSFDTQQNKKNKRPLLAAL